MSMSTELLNLNAGDSILSKGAATGAERPGGAFSSADTVASSCTILERILPRVDVSKVLHPAAHGIRVDLLTLEQPMSHEPSHSDTRLRLSIAVTATLAAAHEAGDAQPSTDLARALWLELFAIFARGRDSPESVKLQITQSSLSPLSDPGAANEMALVDGFASLPQSSPWPRPTLGDSSLELLSEQTVPTLLPSSQNASSYGRVISFKRSTIFELYRFADFSLYPPSITAPLAPLPYIEEYTALAPNELPAGKIRHPRRPAKPAHPSLVSLSSSAQEMEVAKDEIDPTPSDLARTLVYRRPVPHLSEYYPDIKDPLVFSYHLFPPTPSNLRLLHSWLNQPRVDRFWMDAGTIEEHVDWLDKRWQHRNTVPVVGVLKDGSGKGVGWSAAGREEQPPRTITDESLVQHRDDGRMCYLELYWAKEDKISGYYQADDYDRGIHMLVGSPHHRGAHKIRAWLPSVCHYIFLADPRTRRIVCEPNALNDVIKRHLEAAGFIEERTVDFGYKKARIMVLERERFWNVAPF